MQFQSIMVPIFKLCNAVNGGGTDTVYATVIIHAHVSAAVL